jgi:polyhydroxybutyrate depolymerase
MLPMSASLVSLVLLLAAEPEKLKAGDHSRSVTVGEQKRSYHVHIPKKYDSGKPTPVVLAYHGAAMNGRMMMFFCGLNKKSDEAGFIVVYPNGTGANETFLTWNAGGTMALMSRNKVDDIAFTAKLLDDLGSVVNVDAKRVFACGMSNGGMMCYRVAAELSDRIAAVAPVAGSQIFAKAEPKRPVPIIHFHGTLDTLVPFEPKGRGGLMRRKSIEDTAVAWAKIDGCSEKPVVTEMPKKEGDKVKVKKKTWEKGKDGAEVVLYVLEGAGHTWPGSAVRLGFLGETSSLPANDLMWEFFQKHPMK